MGLTSAVHWWEEWQMRVLVLSSLVIQFLLLIFTFARRYAIHKLFRFIMWIAYLASDAVAIYALATLFNRHKDQNRRGSGTLELELVWAPILLLHLGGHDGITAYNIEDNELWSRHLLTAVSQVTVAIYVFWKFWPSGGNNRLLQASILLFVPGVFKCFTKPFALRRASITSLVSSPAAKRTAKKGQGGEMDPHSLEKYLKGAKAFVQEQKGEANKAQSGRACAENGDHPPPQQEQNEDDMDAFEEYVKQKRDFVVGEQNDEGGAQGERAPTEEDTKRTGRGNESKRARILRREAYKLFVDLSSPYAGSRLSIFKYFWLLRQEKAETTTTRKSKREQEDKGAPTDSSKKEEDKANTAYGYVREGLASAFLLLYTKLKTCIPTETDLEDGSLFFEGSEDGSLAAAIGILFRGLIQQSRMILPWAAISLFHKSHREASYNDTDAKITYALLCCTAVLEGYSIFPILFTEMDSSSSDKPAFFTREQWPEMVAQYNLVGYFARNKNHGKLMWVASNLGCRDLVDRHWCMEPCFSSRGITELVLGYLIDGWREKIKDVASYRSFIDNRGHWALEGEEDLRWTLKEPFDESVLLWHIATDFCFFSSPFSEHRCALAKAPSIWSEIWLRIWSGSEMKGDTKCGELAACRAVQCRQMSNYMVYLLFVNPEMLLPGTRRNLFTAAYNELKDILRDEKLMNTKSCCQKVEEKELMETLINTVREKSNKQDPNTGSQEESKEEGQQLNEGSQDNFIDDAWHLAQGLLKLRDDLGDEKMWEVIQGVWVEMLCFSAGRCRGYLHAKALGSGGEFLSYVWLLRFYMGMETLSEKLQREELPRWEANNNGAPAPQASDAYNGNGNGTTSSPSRIRNHGPSSPSHIHTGVSTSSPDIHIVDVD